MGLIAVHNDMRRSLSATNALQAGFAAMLVLLVASAWEASLLQRAGSESELDAYESYVKVDEAISELRRVAWLGSTQSRDYFLDEDSDREKRYSRQIERSRANTRQPLETLRQIEPQRFHRLEIQERFDALFSEMINIAATSEKTGRPIRILVHETVGVRRNEVQAALQNFSQESLNDLHQAQIRSGEQQARTRERLFVLLGIAVLAGAVIAAFSLRHAAKWDRDRQLYYEQLEQANGRLESLSMRLLEIQEEERVRLSRELHDEVGQSLTALRMEISWALRAPADSAAARERLMRARELAERCVQVVRDLSLMLRPSILDDLGLGSAVQWLIEEFSRRSQVTVNFDGQSVGEDLPDALKTCVFRVVQEALNNIEKHAHASRVDVSLRHEEENGLLMLEIGDDGVGFEAARGGKLSLSGAGILGMRERVSRLHGEFHLDSKRGAGTRIYVRLPAPLPPSGVDRTEEEVRQ